MRNTNEFGLFVDQAQPVNRTFAALMIKNEQHRKILNRQPVIKWLNGIALLWFNWKVLNN